MGSPLGPVLANIIMTELEQSLIPGLVNDGTVKFYTRFVDDTLLLAKPSDFDYILDLFNSFHHNIKFTFDSFENSANVHFLDISFDMQGTMGIYRKGTHTGQYAHFESIVPWAHKVSWIRSLLYRAHRICSPGSSLDKEIDMIKKLVSWNGFPKYIFHRILSNINIQNNVTNDISVDNRPKIWMRLPFIGKQGSFIIHKCIKKISRHLTKDVKFITLWQTKQISYFTSNKDRTPKEYCSSVIYKFKCPGCLDSYIGKTDRCLKIRAVEHSRNTNSSVREHIENCEGFNHIIGIHLMTADNTSKQSLIESLLFENINIIHGSVHWSEILFAEALAIRRYKPSLNYGLRASKEIALFT